MSDAPSFDVETFFELSIRANEEWRKRRSDRRTYDRRIDTSGPIAVVFISDMHVGSPGTRHLQLRDDLRTITQHPGLYLYWGGDWADNFILPVLMHAGQDAVFSAGDQQYEVVLYLMSIPAQNDTLLAIGDGNHDNWLRRVANIDSRYRVLQKVQHLYTRQGSILKLRVGEQTYRIFRRHRQRWSSVFNPAHSVVAEYQRNPFDFDIGVIEHQHMSHSAWFDGKMRDDGSSKRIAIRPGTYKLDDAHAEEHGYYYASNELQCVVLWPDRFQMQIVSGLQNAIEVLDGLS